MNFRLHPRSRRSGRGCSLPGGCRLPDLLNDMTSIENFRGFCDLQIRSRSSKLSAAFLRQVGIKVASPSPPPSDSLFIEARGFAPHKNFKLHSFLRYSLSTLRSSLWQPRVPLWSPRYSGTNQQTNKWTGRNHEP